MKVQLTRVNQAYHFEATAKSSDVKVHIDGPENIGGEGKGVRPMELVLIALGSCSVFDLGEILKKQRQEITDIQEEVEGKRREELPQFFTNIHIVFHLTGKNIDEERARKAAQLAVKKYCSVHDMLAAGGVEITYEVNFTEA